MRVEDFSASAPGEAIQMAEGYAFLPARLPPSLEIAIDLLLAVERASAALGQLQGLATQVKNLDLVTALLRRREAVFSSRIEGTQTQVRELLLAEAAPAALPDEDSDLFEVANYRTALDRGWEWVEAGHPLSLFLLRSLHSALMRGVRGEDKQPGEFRKIQVYIGDRDRGLTAAHFVPAPAEQVAPLIDDLISFIGAPTVYGPLIDSAILHYQFEAIHPFEDGNGRLGRLLIPLFLRTAGVLDRPVLYLSPYFEAHRDRYIDLLRRVSTCGEWEAWVLFFLEAVRREAGDASARVRRMLDLQARYDSLVRPESKTAVVAIDLIMKSVFISVPELESHANTSAPTARAAIERLEGLGILTSVGRVRGRNQWIAQELLERVYEPPTAR